MQRLLTHGPLEPAPAVGGLAFVLRTGGAGGDPAGAGGGRSVEYTVLQGAWKQ
jgi:hypothetical protein